MNKCGRGEEEGGTDHSSSPPCFLQAVDPAYQGFLCRDDLLALLNELLEAERTGAKVARAMTADAGRWAGRKFPQGVGGGRSALLRHARGAYQTTGSGAQPAYRRLSRKGLCLGRHGRSTAIAQPRAGMGRPQAQGSASSYQRRSAAQRPRKHAFGPRDQHSQVRRDLDWPLGVRNAARCGSPSSFRRAPVSPRYAQPILRAVAGQATNARKRALSRFLATTVLTVGEQRMLPAEALLAYLSDI